jgi:hypothetical protein
VAGNGGAVGSGGAAALGGTTGTVLGGAGGNGTGGTPTTGSGGARTGGVVGSGGMATSCYWQGSSGRSSFKHFTFLLTTPDGKTQSPPSTYSLTPPPDGGIGRDHDFQGLIAEKSGNQFTVDSCLPALPCQPSLYRFALCDSLSCAAIASPAPIEIPIPVGRRVRVVWRMDNDAPGWCPGLYWLAIYDGEPGTTQGNLLFLGSGGYDPNPDGAGAIPFQDLPFSVALKPLSCGRNPTDASWVLGDDYAFVFSPKSGAGLSLQLGTGESGPFDFTWPAGNAQKLQIHCLDAVQPNHTDDYWNWDFWAEGEPVLSPVDAGAGGG